MQKGVDKMNMAGERVNEMSGAEESRLITYLESLGWSDKQILELLKYVRR